MPHEDFCASKHYPREKEGSDLEDKLVFQLTHTFLGDFK